MDFYYSEYTLFLIDVTNNNVNTDMKRRKKCEKEKVNEKQKGEKRWKSESMKRVRREKHERSQVNDH